MHDFQNIITSVVSYIQSWLKYQNKALHQLCVDVSKPEHVPKLNFDWLFWVRIVVSHIRVSQSIAPIRPQNLYLPVCARKMLFCLPQRNVAEFMRPTEGFPMPCFLLGSTTQVQSASLET